MSESRKAILHDVIIRRGGVHGKSKKAQRAENKRKLKEQLNGQEDKSQTP